MSLSSRAPHRTPEALRRIELPLAGLFGLGSAYGAARAIAAARIGAMRGRARLGAAWWLIDPLLQIGGWLLFVSIVRGGAHDAAEAAAIGASVAIWRAVITIVMEAGDGYLKGAALTRLPNLPRLALPIAAALTAAFGSLFSALIIAIFLLVLDPLIAANAALPLLLIFATAVITGAGLGFLLAAIAPFSPDLRRFLRSSLRMVFFATPVLYGIDQVGDQTLRGLLALNPLSPLFEAIRAAIAGEITAIDLLLPVVLGLSAVALGAGLCRRWAGRIAAAV